jgi:hypothetical protein
VQAAHAKKLSFNDFITYGRPNNLKSGYLYRKLIQVQNFSPRMKRLFVLLFLGMASGIAVSQPQVTVGKPYAVTDAFSKNYYYENGEVLTIKQQKKLLVIQKMNASTLAFQKIRSYDDFPSDYQIESIMNLGHRYYLFYSLWQDEQEKLFVREIDFASGTFKDAGKKVLTVNEKISGALTRSGGFFGRYATGDKFDFFSSYDGSTLVIQYRMKPEIRSDSKNYDRIGMHVIGNDLSEKWSDIVTMPYTEKKMDNLDYSVDAAGNVYIVTRVYNDNTTDQKKRGDDNANYKLEILKVPAAGRKISATKVDVADKFINKIWLYETPRHDMVCAGYYANGKTDNGTDGVIVFKLDRNTAGLTDLRSYEIPVSVLNQYASKKTQRKNSRKEADDEAEASFLNLREVVIHDDGSMLITGEESFIRSYSRTMNGNTSYYEVYYYNDILVTKIDAAGKLAWMKKLPKRQQGSAGRGGMSYAYFDGGIDHFFLFLDHEKNMELPITKEPATHTDGAGGFLTAYKINDQTGDVEKVSVLNTRNVNGTEIFQFAPSRILATEPNTLVFEAYKKKKEDVLVKIVLR